MKRMIMLVACCLIASLLKGQEYNYSHFLHVSEDQVKNYLAQKHAVLKSDKFFDELNGPPHKMLLYVFPQTFEKDELYQGWFFMTKNNACFKYMLWYRSDKFLDNTIKEYDEPNSGFDRIGSELKWKKSNIEVVIAKVRSNSDILKTAYTVEVRLFKEK